MSARTDSVRVEWYPEFRDGAAVPVVQSMTIGEHRFVVIDPADRKAVERVVAAVVHAQDWTPYDADDSDAQIIAAVQAALREFANPPPPKPDEPTGLGAVVEDADGFRWIRQRDDRLGSPWYRRNSPGTPQHRAWHEIAAVRVLSEGVTA